MIWFPFRSPRERVGSTLFVIGMAYFYKRQFDEAAAKLRVSLQDHPGYPRPYRFLAACYAHMGRLDEARAIIARAALGNAPELCNNLRDHPRFRASSGKHCVERCAGKGQPSAIGHPAS